MHQAEQSLSSPGGPEHFRASCYFPPPLRAVVYCVGAPARPDEGDVPRQGLRALDFTYASSSIAGALGTKRRTSEFVAVITLSLPVS